MTSRFPHVGEAVRRRIPRELRASPDRALPLRDLDPALAEELEAALHTVGEAALASAAATITVVDRCRCSDPDCASIYTAPQHTRWHWRRGGRTVELSDNLSVDTVGEQIIAIEAFYRPTLKQTLQTTFR